MESLLIKLLAPNKYTSAYKVSSRDMARIYVAMAHRFKVGYASRTDFDFRTEKYNEKNRIYDDRSCSGCIRC